MSQLPPLVLQLLALVIVMFALFVGQSYMRFRYSSATDPTAWKLGIPIQTRQLSEAIIARLRQLQKPPLSKGDKKSESKRPYIIGDGNQALVLATPVAKQRHLTVGYCDLSSGTLQIRIGLVELLHVLIRLLFTVLAIPFVMSMFIAFGVNFLAGINLYLFAIPLVALTLWQLVRFVMNEGDVIEQFLHDKFGAKKLQGGTVNG